MNLVTVEVQQSALLKRGSENREDVEEGRAINTQTN
ncbi:hypothetical protein C5S35_01390 [Candidatus Methanophagaceae archaeon]|nr:hypothetical protein C5S35_01390 [Methanophagales archaeon]